MPGGRAGTIGWLHGERAFGSVLLRIRSGSTHSRNEARSNDSSLQMEGSTTLDKVEYQSKSN